MNTKQVLEGIERVAVKVAQSIFEGRGLTFDIPSRAASNQIYVPELDRCVCVCLFVASCVVMCFACFVSL